MPRGLYTPKIKPTHAHAIRRAECEGRILELLKTEPMGHHELGAALGLSLVGVRKYLDSLHAGRKIYICEWRRAVTIGPPRPYFALGKKPDAVFVPVRVPGRSQTVIGADNREKIYQALVTPLSSNKISEQVHVSVSGVMRHLEALRAEGKVRICGWRRAGRGIAPIYGHGSEPDAERPEPTVRIRSQKDRELAASRNSAIISIEASRAATEQTIAKAKARPNGIFGALGVEMKYNAPIFLKDEETMGHKERIAEYLHHFPRSTSVVIAPALDMSVQFVNTTLARLLSDGRVTREKVEGKRHIIWSLSADDGKPVRTSVTNWPPCTIRDPLHVAFYGPAQVAA